jgi:hypothetical protein
VVAPYRALLLLYHAIDVESLFDLVKNGKKGGGIPSWEKFFPWMTPFAHIHTSRLVLLMRSRMVFAPQIDCIGVKRGISAQSGAFGLIFAYLHKSDALQATECEFGAILKCLGFGVTVTHHTTYTYKCHKWKTQPPIHGTMMQ